MNIVILDANTLTLDNDIDFSVFNQYGDVTIYQSSTDEEVGERIKDAEVVLCNKTVLNADKLSKAPNLSDYSQQDITILTLIIQELIA